MTSRTDSPGPPPVTRSRVDHNWAAEDYLEHHIDKRIIAISFISPLTIQTDMIINIPMIAVILIMYPILESRDGQFSLGIKHGTRHESAGQHNLVSPLVLAKTLQPVAEKDEC